MAKSLLDDREVIPLFHLPARDGRLFDSSEFKRRKNLVIFFLSRPEKEFFVAVEEAYALMKEQNAEAIVISPVSGDTLEEIHQRNRLTYWILSDGKREVFSKFIQASPGEGVAALFITDKFGEVFFQYVAPAIKDLPPFDDIVKSLNFIESQCPECLGGL